jgi:hypothetical protein
MGAFINWFIDSMASEDVIDLYFILTDMVDINLTDAEICQTAYYDALATQTAANVSCDSGTPSGKMVC